MQRIGFIGLGHMGAPMAVNLIKANHPVVVFDIDERAMAACVQQGAVAAQTIPELAKQADVIMTMLQTGEQVSQCCLGDAGVFNHMSDDAMFVDCSSVDIADSKSLHATAKEQHIAMLDAPVSGGVAAAEAGSLTFMVGGESEHYEKIKPILSAMGKKIIHAGEGGSGAAAKICNNMILGVSMIAVSEAFILAEKLGLKPEKLYEISSNASGQCWSLTQYCPWPDIMPNVPSSHDYKAGFMASMMLKDLKLSQLAAEFANVDTPLGKHAQDLYQQFVDDGNAEVDFSGVIKQIKDL